MGVDWKDIVFNGNAAPTPPTPPLPANVLPINGGSAYARKALADECTQLANTAAGRNHRLNIAAFNMASLVDAGHLDRQEVIDALTAAANIASAIGDHPLTTTEIANTIESGFRGSHTKVGARHIPEQPALPGQVTEVTAATIAASAPLALEAAPHDLDKPAPAEAEAEPPPSAFGTHQPIDAAAFLFDTEDTTVALWGEGDDILWAEGEALMIAGGMGLGKTTLAGQIIRAQLGLEPTEVLGLPVTPVDGPILYLAMDRPRQIRRSMLRQFNPADRHRIENRLLIRVGPPIADIAAYPGLLAAMAAEVGAAVIYVDSLKDAAIGLSDDKVGAAYNRARQQVLADGCQICELHHNRKAQAGLTASGSVTEVYGSTWLTSGAGSVITLTGDPGDPIIEMRHVKQPLNEVGPYRILNNHAAGQMQIDHQVDLLMLAQANRTHGLTAQAAAGVMFDTDKPTRNQTEKARYKLDKLTSQKLLVRVDGMRGGAAGANAASWFPADQ